MDLYKVHGIDSTCSDVFLDRSCPSFALIEELQKVAAVSEEKTQEHSWMEGHFQEPFSLESSKGLDGPIRANRFTDSHESLDSRKSLQGSRTEPQDPTKARKNCPGTGGSLPLLNVAFPSLPSLDSLINFFRRTVLEFTRTLLPARSLLIFCDFLLIVC